jgi:predicted phosphodiesterase
MGIRYVSIQIRMGNWKEYNWIYLLSCEAIVRYLILSDIHGNLPAFEAVLADAGEFDKVWCLGDVIGYGPQPNECIARLRQFAHICVAGNHDWAAINKLDVSSFNPEARQACLWTREQLTPEHWDYVESLSEKLVEGDFTLVHGSPRYPIWEYISDPSVAAANLPFYDTPYCLFGHTHVPAGYTASGDKGKTEAFVMPLGETFPLPDPRWLINPGGVGQPRDGDPRASYLIYDRQVGTLQHRRVEYSIEETQRLMAARRLPDRLAARLLFGW